MFGINATLKFLEIFGGTTITVPTADVFQDAAKAAEVYVRCASGPDTEEHIAKVAWDTKISVDAAKSYYTEMREIVDAALPGV